MSAATADYESLLQSAIDQARANAPRATEDLLRFSSQAASAVAKVTGGAAALELLPVNQGEGATTTYQLQLRKIGSEAPPSDLGVYRVTEAGYPVLRWFSRRGWESAPDEPTQKYSSASELEGNFRWMLSNSESRLVVLVTFFQQKTASPNGSEV